MIRGRQDQSTQIFIQENFGERGRVHASSSNCGESKHADGVRLGELESLFDDLLRGVFLYVTDIPIEHIDVVGIHIDKCAFNVEPESQEIFDRVLDILRNLLRVSLARVHVPFIIGDGNDDRDRELLLDLLGHLEGDHVAEVQALSLRALGDMHVERGTLLEELGEAALLSEVDTSGDPLVSDLGLDEV